MDDAATSSEAEPADAVDTDVTDVDAAETDVTEADAFERATAEPNAFEPDAADSHAVESDVVESDVAGSDVGGSDAYEADALATDGAGDDTDGVESAAAFDAADEMSHVPRPLGQAPLLDSEPLPATRPGMLRPRNAERRDSSRTPDDSRPSEGHDSFSLPVQRPAFDLGSGEPADVT